MLIWTDNVAIAGARALTEIPAPLEVLFKKSLYARLYRDLAQSISKYVLSPPYEKKVPSSSDGDLSENCTFNLQSFNGGSHLRAPR
jgi:hypothetical protein